MRLILYGLIVFGILFGVAGFWVWALFHISPEVQTAWFITSVTIVMGASLPLACGVSDD